MNLELRWNFAWDLDEISHETYKNQYYNTTKTTSFASCQVDHECCLFTFENSKFMWNYNDCDSFMLSW